MRIIDITHPPQSLWIGREGENTFRPVSFECANWFSAYPDATIAAYYQPYGSSDPYPLVLVEDGTKRIWHPLLNELVKGDGELQIALMQGDTVGTSAIIPTKVDRSLISNADHPASESPSWAVEVVQDVTEQADRAEEAARRAEEAGGDVDPEQIAEAVENYFDEHPVVVEETDPNAVHFDTPQTLTPAQKEQARGNIGAGTYSKPSGGIPASDLAAGVIPVAPQMATQADMSDWTSGKTVDAAVLKSDFTQVGTILVRIGDNVDSIASGLETKADESDIPTKVSDLTNDSNFQTAAQVQSAIAAIPDELPTVSASDNGKFLRVVSGAWAAETVSTWQGGSY